MEKSMASNRNPKPPLAPATRTGEEGDLLSSSSGGDDENPVSSAVYSAGNINPPAPAPGGSYHLIHASKNLSQGIQAGTAISSTSYAMQSRKSVQLPNGKSSVKNRVPLKSGNLGWNPALDTKNNLVIRFSDSDSDHESEDGALEKGSDNSRNTTGVDSSSRAPPLPSAKTNNLQLPARNMNKVIPKKSSLSRTFVPSMNKITGGVNSQGAGTPSVECGSRNLSASNKIVPSQEHGSDRGVGLNNTKMQDLRQQIALRERELQLKGALPNKESVAPSGRDYNATNPHSDAARKAVSSTDVSPIEPKEPDRKRLKINNSYSTLLNSDVRSRQELLAAKSTSPSEEQVSGRKNSVGRSMVDPSRKGNIDRRTQSSMVKFRKQDGLNNNSEGCQSDHSSMQDLNQTAAGKDVDSGTLSWNTRSVELNHTSKSSEHQLPLSLAKTPTGEQNLKNISQYNGGERGDGTIGQLSNNICQESLSSASLWHYLGGVHASEDNNMDMQSLVEMEESLDKELEEAQELRRKCEIEERNALKAYRKAQRDLIEANARCSDLYRKREVYSSHVRSLIMDNSSMLWSSGQHKSVETGLDCGNNISRNLDLLPSSSCRMQPEYEDYNQPECGSYLQRVGSAPLITPYQHGNGQNLESEPCSEPDASTSEPLAHHCKNASNGASSPSNGPNISGDEDEEMFPCDNARPNFENQQGQQDSERRQDTKSNANGCFSVDGSHNSLALEATLRSELFARLGMRALSKNSGSSNSEPVDELGTDNDNRSDRTHASNCSVPLSDVGKSEENDIEGNDKPGRNVYEASLGIQKQDKGSSPLVLRSIYNYMKVFSPLMLSALECETNRQDEAHTCNDDEDACIRSEEIPAANLTANSKENYIFGAETGSFTCHLEVDPHWPLCMYELRGKCNNDECPWQHVRDFSNGKTCEWEPEGSDGAGTMPHQQKNTIAKKHPKCCSVLSPTTYLVGFDILKANPHSYEPPVSGGKGQSWKSCFSVCLALSSLLQIPSDEPLLHGGDGRIEVHGSWNRQTSYFQSRNTFVNHLNQKLASQMQSLETSLLILGQEVNKLEGINKALSNLARAIETNPTSEILWIAYLLIYYSNTQSHGKDEDMFSHAVRHHDKSYGLWLMYINSRVQLDDRLVAYDVALAALCSQASASDRDELHASACLLDLFLQMMNCLCMSGMVDKAIRKICGLLPAEINSDEPHSLLLSDILSCLRISDKFMCWVCCVYLVIYRKLPDAVVQRFELDKELISIEWPSVHLLGEEKQRICNLVEMMVNSVKSCIDSESLQSETLLRSLQHFAICHVRCMVTIDGFECCQNLLEKYLSLYPSCLELVLTYARAQSNDFGGSSFEGFEEALSNWPKEVPGSQCIWNQYIEYAIENGCIDLAKDLIIRWSKSVSEVQNPPSGSLGVGDGSSSDELLELASASRSNLEVSIQNSEQMDRMFGYLNLSLAKLMQNDPMEARIAISKAFNAAAPQYFKHCLREHCMFSFFYESQSKKDPLIDEQLKLLSGYLSETQAFTVTEPLSRQFINNIEKPRVRQLFRSMLCPVSYDLSMVNLILEMWNGPSLLPQKLSQPKELVDFVQAVLEIVPSNYSLALSACKLLRRDCNTAGVTSRSLLYWASSTLVNAIFHAIPIAPEHVWVEAAAILGDIARNEFLCDRFYKRALSVYPFSLKLWSSYYNLSMTRGGARGVLEAAREKGIKLV